MSEKALLESYLSCHVCSETFRDPVSLRCDHNFCSGCLQGFWKQAGDTNCPICKRKASNDHPPVSFGLKKLAVFFDDLQQTASSETEEEEQSDVEEVCSEHPGEPKLFCVDEQRAVCPVCEVSLHRTHKVLNLKQAVSQLKDQLSCDFKSLQDRRNKCLHVHQTYGDMSEHGEKQLVSTEKQIRTQFNKLHQFLREEEESRLAALREEGEQKRKTLGREMKVIEDQISSLSDSLCAVEAELQKDSWDFLSSYKGARRRAGAQVSLSDPQLLPGLLIDQAKHLGNLAFSVWDKMKDQVHFTPVILDPNTASCYLHLSDDLTSVRPAATRQHVPDNPERSANHTNVFGREGFSSGEHSWEVEVGDLPVWNVGVAKESADRKEDCFASVEDGFWCLVHHKGEYCDAAGRDLQVKKRLQRIRVQLQWDRGEVSFYDSEDMTLICTLRHSFTETLFPYFHVFGLDDAKTTSIKVCPRETSL